MYHIAVNLTNYLINNNIVNLEMRDEYVYGFEILFGKIVNYGTLLFLAYINQNLIHTLFFMGTFFTLRGRTGGYHCKKELGCYLGTLIIYAVVTWFITPMLFRHTKLILAVMFISEIIIFAISPINHPNLRLSKDEIIQCKSASRWLTILIMICIFLFLWLDIIPDIIPYLVAGIGIDAGLLALAKILKQEVKVK